MELYDAIIDFLSVFPEGNPMIIKDNISKQSDKMLAEKFHELISISNDDNYILVNISKLDNCYNMMYLTILELIKNEVICRINNKSRLSIHALEFIPMEYKLNNNSIKHIKNMLNNPYIIKHNKSITIDNILMNNQIKPMYNKDIMIQLIKSSNEFSYDDSTKIIKLIPSR